jgi:hypothetical protein
MLWVDNTNYFGPDRRCKRTMRMLERRRENYAGRAPSLSIAMRQLRMRVLDAQGAQAAPFADRLRGVAHLARMHNEPAVSNALTQLATALAASRDADVRNKLYAALDRAHGLMRNA